jgi:chromosome partitioning protein
MTRTIAVVNHIGGSGKTTTAVNLAACIGELGKHVLLIDLDAQADASYWCGIKDTDHKLFDLFIKNLNLIDLIHPWVAQGVEVIPSSDKLTEVEKVLAGKIGSEETLRYHLSRLPSERWDYILLDCPSSSEGMTVNALTAAHSAIIPVEAHVMALKGLPQLLKLIETVQQRLNSYLKILGILPCRVTPRTRHNQEVMELLRAHFGTLVYDTFIREDIRLAENPSFGKPITQYHCRSSGAEDYRALTKEIIERELQSG